MTISHDYAEGVNSGYGQGAGATAELIRNRLGRMLATERASLRATLGTFVRELTTDYGLEPLDRLPKQRPGQHMPHEFTRNEDDDRDFSCVICRLDKANSVHI
jgi:hypothetical protein